VEAGIDMFENKTEDQSFYSSSTIHFCCSESEGDSLFALLNGANRNTLLPICAPPKGERYISSVTGSDTQNSCLNIDMPCESLENAILSGQLSLQVSIDVIVVGEYEGTETVIPPDQIVYIQSVEDSQSMPACLFFLFTR
jgi:hypothetical protein